MDSRQQSIYYLMIQCSELSKVCADALMSVHKTKADLKVEHQVAIVLNAIKEITGQLNLSEDRIFVAIEREQKKREVDL